MLFITLQLDLFGQLPYAFLGSFAKPGFPVIVATLLILLAIPPSSHFHRPYYSGSLAWTRELVERCGDENPLLELLSDPSGRVPPGRMLSLLQANPPADTASTSREEWHRKRNRRTAVHLLSRSSTYSAEGPTQTYRQAQWN